MTFVPFRRAPRPRPSDAEIARELRDHLDLEAEEIARGSARFEDAEFAAQAEIH